MSSAMMDAVGDTVDMRISDVWQMLFEREQVGELDTEFIGWLLRLAYVNGYFDALTEPRRGQLCSSLGYPIPPRPGGAA